MTGRQSRSSRTTIHRILLLIVTLLTPAAVAAEPASCPQFFPGGQPPALLNPRLAERATLLCNDAYAVVASGLTHGALWSAEHPTADSVAAARRTARTGRFHADGRLPPEDRAQLRDYRRSGFDRGHMTPSGDTPDKQAQQQSFSLANIVPQTAQLNRGVWEGIESAMRKLAIRKGELYLVTGAAFQETATRSIGPDGVLVPIATWKAVYDPLADRAGVYVCSNTAEPICHTMSVARLIAATGVDPFPALPDGVKRVAMRLPSLGRDSSNGARHRTTRG